MAPDKVKSEDAMTFGELLALIADQKRRLNVLKWLSLIWPSARMTKANQLLIHSLKLESHSQNRDAETQKHFAHLAEELEKCLHGSPPPAGANNALLFTHPKIRIPVCRIIVRINIYFANFGDNPPPMKADAYTVIALMMMSRIDPR